MTSYFLKRCSQIFSNFTSTIFLLPPFILFLFLCQDFINGQITLNVDAAAHYCITKFYINNLLEGVFPLWEPFVNGGRPFIALINGGMLNPFINIVLLGVVFGLNYYKAYVVFILFYYFVGLIGFFVLSRIVIKDDRYAYFSYVALTFSGMGLMVFNQMYVLLIFVPSVWFFVFLLRFLNSFQRKDFLGLVLSFMIMEVSYYPFYLLTVILVSFVVLLFFHLDKAASFVRNLFSFLWRNKLIAVIGLIGLLLSSAPLILYKVRDHSSEIIAPCRHIGCSNSSLDVCLKSSQMDFRDVGFEGTFGERAGVEDLFIEPRKFRYVSDDFFYVPIFCILIILLSAVNYIDRSKKIVLWIWIITFLISMGGIAPLHRILFEHVFYFKYFRNFFFFMAFLIPLTILFSAQQLKALLETEFLNRSIKIAFVVIIHFIFLLFASRQSPVLQSTYLTIELSMVFFVLCCFVKDYKLKILQIAALFVLLLLQPAQLFALFKENAYALNITVPFFAEHVKPVFEFKRPIDGRSGNPVFKMRDFGFDSMLTLSDSNGSYKRFMPDSVSRWNFLLMKKMGSGSIIEYIRNKFYLYSNVVYYQENDEKVWNNVKESILNAYDNVYAFDKHRLKTNIDVEKQRDFKNKAQIIDENFRNFAVTSFNANELKLSYQLDKPNFLLYTDNFTSDWHAYIDGRETQIYRSNISFKGMELPAGKHILKLSYRPLGGAYVYLICALFMSILFFVVCFSFFRMAINGKEVKREGLGETESSESSDNQHLLYTAGVYYLIIFCLCACLINFSDLSRLRKQYFLQEIYTKDLMKR